VLNRVRVLLLQGRNRPRPTPVNSSRINTILVASRPTREEPAQQVRKVTRLLGCSRCLPSPTKSAPKNEIRERRLGLAHKPDPHRSAAEARRCRPMMLAAYNSAGKYPLISRATQISIRLGVLQVISISLCAFCRWPFYPCMQIPRRGRYFELGDLAAGPLLLPGIP